MVEPVIVGGPAGFLFPSAIAGDPPGYQVYVRDAVGNPIPFATVILDFGAAPMRVYDIQNPGTAWACPPHVIVQDADALGRTSFGARVAGFALGPMVRVIANGVFLNMVQSRTTDLDAGGGRCDAVDAGIFRTAFYSGLYRPEIDYNLSGTIDVGDLNIFRTELFAGTPVEPYCP